MRLCFLLFFSITIFIGCSVDRRPISKNLFVDTTAGTPTDTLYTNTPGKSEFEYTQTEEAIQIAPDSSQNSNQAGVDETDPSAEETVDQDQVARDAGARSDNQSDEDAQIGQTDASSEEIEASVLAGSGGSGEEAVSGSDGSIQKPPIVCDTREPSIRCGATLVCEGFTPYCFVTFNSWSSTNDYYCGLVPLILDPTAISYACDDSCDCPPGLLCCYGADQGVVADASSKCASDCGATASGVQLCRVDAECPDQMICGGTGDFTQCIEP